MAQLRHDHAAFQVLNTEIAVIVPNGQKMIEKYITAQAIPYPILSDRGARVAAQYSIKTKNAVVMTAMKPAVFLVDQSGGIIYSKYTDSYISEPDNREPLQVLEKLKG